MPRHYCGHPCKYTSDHTRLSMSTDMFTNAVNLSKYMKFISSTGNHSKQSTVRTKTKEKIQCLEFNFRTNDDTVISTSANVLTHTSSRLLVEIARQWPRKLTSYQSLASVVAAAVLMMLRWRLRRRSSHLSYSYGASPAFIESRRSLCDDRSVGGVDTRQFPAGGWNVTRIALESSSCRHHKVLFTSAIRYRPIEL